MTNKSSYKSIFKSTSLFGGVQVFKIIVSMISAKFVAVLLGAEGIGIMGLLTAPMGIITNITGFGIGIASVRESAEAYGSGNKALFSRVVIILRRWVWATGTLGALVVIILSPYLSEISFGNRDYMLWFVALSITILLKQISDGQTVVLRATRRLKDIANSAITGSLIGLFIGIPMYYLWGVNGIVPAMIVGSVSTLFRSWYFSRRVHIENISVSVKETYHGGIDMVKLGFIIVLTGLIGSFTAYLLKIYIGRFGGISDVGLFAAGFAVSNTYVGMMFTAMDTDYFPRLSAVNKDNDKVKVLVNHQIEMSFLIMAPLIMLFLSFIPLLLRLLYSQKFFPIIGMMQWIALGLLLKAVAWALATIIVAKGDRKFFASTEFITQIYFFGFNLLGYTLFGLEGIGMAFLVSYFIYLVQEIIIVKKRYKFVFFPDFYKIFFPQMLMAIMLFLNVRLMSGITAYAIDLILVSLSFVFSIKHLNKRIDIIPFIKKRMKGLFKK